jgi:hypothetical protein
VNPKAPFMEKGGDFRTDQAGRTCDQTRFAHAAPSRQPARPRSSPFDPNPQGTFRPDRPQTESFGGGMSLSRMAPGLHFRPAFRMAKMMIIPGCGPSCRTARAGGRARPDGQPASRCSRPA